MIADLPTRKAQGSRWEDIIVAFLTSDPLYRKRFAEVHLWKDWAAGRTESKQDKGIDIVAVRYDGGLCAVQCKFKSDSTKKLGKGDVDSFIANASPSKYEDRIVAFSGFGVSRNLEQQLLDNDVQLLAGMVLSQANVSWGELATAGKGMLVRKPLKKIRDYQREAIEKLKEELNIRKNQKATLVMACGSGKTYTSQIATEELAGGGKRVLYAVPSLALMAQTIRAWCEEEDFEGRGVKLAVIPVCSDTQVGKAGGSGQRRAADLAQLEIPPTTDSQEIMQQMAVSLDHQTMLVLFSTYQSLPQVLEAQKLGAPDFDFGFMDEAHRTTGVEKDNNSHTDLEGNIGPFQLAHESIKINKRVYMTATPKVFTEAAKVRKKQEEKSIWSMDDLNVYGEQCYRLSFGKAISKNILSDYKVVLSQSPSGLCQDVLHKFAHTDSAKELTEHSAKMLTEGTVAQMIGLYNTLRGNRHDTAGWQPLAKTIVYTTRKIDSKRFANVFPIFAEYLDSLADNEDEPTITAQHVDGTMGANERAEKLHWLDSARQDGEIRLLSNAKVLSEGVDVPSLDALCFLQPKGSEIDIVQSVGRVMRKVEHKNFGYIILPLILPDTTKDFGKYIRGDDFWKTTWAVLRALRSHDERFARELGIIGLEGYRLPANMVCTTTQDDLSSKVIGFGENLGDTSGSVSVSQNRAKEDKDDGEGKEVVDASGLWETPEGKAPEFSSTQNGQNGQNLQFDHSGKPVTTTPIEVFETLPLPLGELLETQLDEAVSYILKNIASTTLEKVGDRHYWNTWSRDAHTAYETIHQRLVNLHEKEMVVRILIDKTAEGLYATLGTRATSHEVISMLAQFIVMKPVFNAMFGSPQYFEDSPISSAMAELVEGLSIYRLENEAANLENFYQSVIESAEAIDRPKDRQDLIKHLYQDFIRKAFPNEARKYGVIYTPIEIVDFILRSVDWSLKEILGVPDGIASENVEVLDPFSGTGTFLVRLVQNEQLLPDAKLEHKFRHNLHSTEIMALPYWATEVNLEQAYQTRKPGKYVPYENGVLADTFTMSLPVQKQTKLNFPSEATKENYDRAIRQDEKKITVIVGNPPWQAAIEAGESAKPAKAWPYIAQRVTETFGAAATDAKKIAMYDTYILALRWASDRINGKGVIGFVTNNGWLTSSSGSGIRRVIEEEFDHAYVTNLRGKLVTGDASNERKREGGSVFPNKVGTQIVILVKSSVPTDSSKSVKYWDMEHLTTNEKLARLTRCEGLVDSSEINWQVVSVDDRGDWIDQGKSEYQEFVSIGNPKTKKNFEGDAIFGLYSNGIITQQDHLAICPNKEIAVARGKAMTNLFNSKLSLNVTEPDFVDKDEAKILKWKLMPAKKLAAKKPAMFSNKNVVEIMCRPFLSQWVIWHKHFNWSQSRLNDMFPVQSEINQIAGQSDLENPPPEPSKAADEPPPPPPPASVRFALQESGIQYSTALPQNCHQICTSTTGQLSASPDIESSQRAISIAGVGTTSGFRTVCHLLPPDLSSLEKAQCFPRYRLEQPKEKTLGGGFESPDVESVNGPLHGRPAGDGRVWVDNILDSTLLLFRKHYQDTMIVKEDVFNYCYGILHSDGYRTKYKNDVKKELARIPFAADFWTFSRIGKQLADLHCGYDKLDGWEYDKLRWKMSAKAQDYLRKVEVDDTSNLPEILDRSENRKKFLNPLYCPKKMQWSDNGATLRVNEHITIGKIPPGAHTYRLAGKSPIQIFVSEYYPKKHKETGIVNDRNLLFKDAPHQLLLRIRQLIQLGVETTDLLSQLPEEFETQ